MLIKLEKGIIEFKNYFKQVPFKIYADFEYSLKSIKCDEGSYTKGYQDHIPCSFAYIFLLIFCFFCIDDRFTKTIL